MNKCFNKCVNNILNVAEKESLDLNHPYVGTEHLLLSLLKNKTIKKISNKYNLYYENFKSTLINIMGMSNKRSEYVLYTPLLKEVIEGASNKAFSDHKEMDEYYLFSSLINEKDGIALQILNNMDVDMDSLILDVNKNGLLYELGVNLNERHGDKIYYRDKEIMNIIEILFRKNKNNPILIGKAGVGKTAIVEEIARRIKTGEVPEKLKNYKIFSINTASLLAGTKYRGEFEEKLNNLIKEVIKRNDIILFIDEVHNIVRTGSSDGAIDAGNILKPYLARGDIKLIGATTSKEYNEYIKRDAALARRFTPVVIKEPNLDEMFNIMIEVKSNFEKYYNLKINKSVIKYLIENVDKYLPNLNNPDKTIEVLDSVCSRNSLINEKFITKDDIFSTIMERLNYSFVDKVNFINIKNYLLDKFNDKIVNNVINIIKSKDRIRYMFLDGADDKNKIKLIDYLANNLDVNKIFIDSQDYNDDASISNFISSDYLYNLIEENPCSFIVFNNYDKCNRYFYNLINMMISKGYVMNKNSDKLYLSNSIIFLFNNSCESKIGFNNNLLFVS